MVAPGLGGALSSVGMATGDVSSAVGLDGRATAVTDGAGGTGYSVSDVVIEGVDSPGVGLPDVSVGDAPVAVVDGGDGLDVVEVEVAAGVEGVVDPEEDVAGPEEADTTARAVRLPSGRAADVEPGWIARATARPPVAAATHASPGRLAATADPGRRCWRCLATSPRVPRYTPSNTVTLRLRIAPTRLRTVRSGGLAWRTSSRILICAGAVAGETERRMALPSPVGQRRSSLPWSG